MPTITGTTKRVALNHYDRNQLPTLNSFSLFSFYTATALYSSLSVVFHLRHISSSSLFPSSSLNMYFIYSSVVYSVLAISVGVCKETAAAVFLCRVLFLLLTVGSQHKTFLYNVAQLYFITERHTRILVLQLCSITENVSFLRVALQTQIIPTRNKPTSRHRKMKAS